MTDFENYCSSLGATMTREEKLFFLNEVNLNDFNIIIDFGCGTGEVLKVIDSVTAHNRNLMMIGIDANEKMRARTASINFDHACVIVNSIEKAESMINNLKCYYNLAERAKVMMIFSSVLHELDGATLEQLQTFCHRYADAIAIRDTVMFEPSYDAPKKEMEMYEKLAANPQFQQVRSNQMGNVHSTLYEWFLKYRYAGDYDSWSREICENYFNPIARNFITELTWPAEGSYFQYSYQSFYTLPFIKKQVRKDFGYDMDCPTHCKLLLKRRETSKEECYR